MQSKFLFVIAIAFKFFLKDGFIILFLLMPLTVTADLADSAADFAVSEPMLCVIATGAVIVGLVLPRFDFLISNRTIK